jgi:flagellum-specific ATP synthase
VLEAVGLRLPVGSDCLIELPTGQHSHGGPRTAEAEVVGFGADRLYLMPQSDVAGLVPGARVYPLEPSPLPNGIIAARRASRDRSGCRLAMACSAACSMPPDDRSMASARLPPPAKFRWPARRSTR